MIKLTHKYFYQFWQEAVALITFWCGNYSFLCTLVDLIKLQLFFLNNYYLQTNETVFVIDKKVNQNKSVLSIKIILRPVFPR